MKTILAIVSLFAVPAFACPQLSGTFACNYGPNAPPVTFATRIENGVHVYSYNNYDLIADGADRPGPKGVTLNTSCAADVVTLKQLSFNQSVGFCTSGTASRIEVTTTWRPDGNDIKERGEGTVTCSDGEVLTGHADYTCVRP